MPHHLYQASGRETLHNGTPSQAAAAAEQMCQTTRGSVALRLHGDNGCKIAYTWREPCGIECTAVHMPMRPADIIKAAETRTMPAARPRLATMMARAFTG